MDIRELQWDDLWHKFECETEYNYLQQNIQTKNVTYNQPQYCTNMTANFITVSNIKPFHINKVP